MKILNKILLSTLLIPSILFAASSTDNEIKIDQTGDTLTLTIDQIGYGNKLCGSISGGTCASDWTLTGNTLTVNIDMIGNSNQIFGPTILDSSTLSINFTGSDNIWDCNVGASGSADSSNLLTTFTGDSNEVDLDWGAQDSAERLDFDFDIDGGSNVFNIDIEVDDATWDVDIDGSSNNIVMSQTDGAYAEITFELVGSNADVDIIQSSGSCPQGVNSCFSIVNADFDTENATITINQKDTSD